MFFVFLFFGREPSKRLVSKMKRRKKTENNNNKKKEKHCKSHFQEFGNRPTSSEMNTKKKTKSSDSFIWKIKKKKTHILVNCTLA